MKTVYSGSSPQKSMIRARAYIEGVQRKDFYSKKHIIIASRECGDIHFLLSLGVHPSRIIACDKDPIALNIAKDIGVVIPPNPFCRDIRKTVDWTLRTYGPESIATVNVDLCQSLPLGIDIIREVIDSCSLPGKEIPAESKILYTFYRSRDKMYSDEERKSFLTDRVSCLLKEWIPYQSYTNISVGSPMCLCVF